jgi:hypothetical protein
MHRSSRALHRAGEALALGGSRHLHCVADLERLDGHGVADRALGVADLDQLAVRADAGMAQVPRLGP